ncbi:MAG TPA: TIGR00730 family Rossman fold protein [Burkholderiales bacterium]|nr:TIGR00730 family Rossman fold protein [Burkholderiales bacterium]
MSKPPQERRRNAVKAYLKESFLKSAGARPLRILAEYLEPKLRFDQYRIEDTIVFMGSARVVSREEAEAEVSAAESDQLALERARERLAMSKYYEEARELSRRLTEWSKQLKEDSRRFVVCTGGGPGIMEAANRGASDARGLSVGLTISIPAEEFDNRYVTRELSFHFHYFFMRKFWFAYLAKALLVFPGGFGTLDEMFEILTLRQTRKMRKHLAVILFGARYWDEVIDFDALVRHGTISRDDLKIFHRTDSVDEAFEIVTRHLVEHAMAEPGAIL